MIKCKDKQNNTYDAIQWVGELPLPNGCFGLLVNPDDSVYCNYSVNVDPMKDLDGVSWGILKENHWLLIDDDGFKITVSPEEFETNYAEEKTDE